MKKKNHYIQQIISHFFHHDVSDEMRRRFYNRMLSPPDDANRDEALKHIWDTLDASSCTDEMTDKAWEQIDATLHSASPSTISEPVVPQVPLSKHSKRPLNNLNWSTLKRVSRAAVWFIPILFLGASLYYYHLSRKYVQHSSSEVAYVQHYAPIGTHEEVILSDGTHVWLNAGSLLVYPSTFTGNSRNVFLAGEAYFDVIKDKKRPFIVSTNFLKMKVLGTTFNVSAYPEDSQVSATLETGILKVMVNDRPEVYLLKPDDQLIYSSLTGKVIQQKVNVSLHTEWRKGGLLFTNVPFSDIMRTLERMYGVKFHVRTSIYQTQHLHAHFNQGESIEHIMRIIQLLLPGMEYEIIDQNIYLY